uniref:Uncharacterized protein n=1 Tax=Myoviridae sp. ctCXW4 TaxID=2827669 RepID=A0A8S5TQ50_9CAUD|nr:MAG TPA: hypothetical protein [Myoviridae sp. ctCXW4]DAH83949.1 MAG TPA: hypothetical protein [Caudoviricetes sp.]DAI97782.1 MAG TPA: hypothetical protein [Caudoviricetes sp.]DAP89690.1 MAG TPA: hypothetical protein [Caudoviricetes sp.]
MGTMKASEYGTMYLRTKSSFVFHSLTVQCTAL